MTQSQLVFLKLGGSLITDKSTARTPRLEVIERLAGEISTSMQSRPGLKLVLGHGSGSFGHIPAKKWGTRQGVRNAQEWLGFLEVYRDARLLNQLVMDSMAAAGVPAVAIPAHAAVSARNGEVVDWNLTPIKRALLADLVPVVFGDVVFDEVIGGTILSTEDLFDHLAGELKPERILLAGIEPGVWLDYPECSQTVAEITPENIPDLMPALGGSSAVDVTGGMASKVLQNLELVGLVPGLEVVIFSGNVPGLTRLVLCGAKSGTTIKASAF